MRTLRDAGVTVVIGCTYFETGVALVRAMHNLSWAPYRPARSHKWPPLFAS